MSENYYNINEPDNKYPEREPEKKNLPAGNGKKLGISALSALVFGVIAAVVFLGVTNFGMSRFGNDQDADTGSVVTEEAEEGEETEKVPTTAADDASESESKAQASESQGFQNAVVSSDGTLTTTQVVDECMPAMVSITGMSVQQVQSFFGTQEYEAGVAGSGIIVGKTDTELLIATNQHVVENTNSLTVTFVDESSVEAEIKGADQKNDLAIVSVPLESISSETLNAISVIKMGDSTQVKAGEEVVAIGNALGYGQSVSRGVISSAARTSNVNGEDKTFIQTDAAINPGNSGGALINMKGELIGINEAKDVGTEIEGVGYAIPISNAWPILEGLMEGETRVKVDEEEAGYIGIASSFSIDEERAKANSAPEGVYVQYLIDGGAAAEAGIKPGDILTTINGQSITTMEGLKEELSYYKAGETVSVTLYRYGDNGYEEMTFDVTLKGAESLENGIGEMNPGSQDEDADEPSDDGSQDDRYYGNEEDRPERPDREGDQEDGESYGGVDDIFNYFFGR